MRDGYGIKPQRKNPNKVETKTAGLRGKGPGRPTKGLDAGREQRGKTERQEALASSEHSVYSLP